VNVSVRERGQATARMMVVDQWLTDLDRPYQFHRRFDSIKRQEIWCFNLGAESVRNADSKGVRGTQVEFELEEETTLDPRRRHSTCLMPDKRYHKQGYSRHQLTLRKWTGLRQNRAPLVLYSHLPSP
jgi:hypothetical protein